MREVGVTEVPKDAQLIDVREPEEFSEAHAQGAVNVPLSQLPERVHEIDPERDIYIICHSGGRSAQAVEHVEQSLGWDNAYNVAGGTVAWIEANLPAQDN